MCSGDKNANKENHFNKLNCKDINNCKWKMHAMSPQTHKIIEKWFFVFKNIKKYTSNMRIDRHVKLFPRLN